MSREPDTKIDPPMVFLPAEVAPPDDDLADIDPADFVDPEEFRIRRLRNHHE
jgi:hypothetical protein